MKTSNIHILDSYKVRKADIPLVVKSYYKTLPQGDALLNRSVRSLCLEWYAHNFLYNLHIARHRTKDVDLNAPQRFWEKIDYPIVGSFGWLFLK